MVPFCYLRLDLRFRQWNFFVLSFVTDGKDGETQFSVLCLQKPPENCCGLIVLPDDTYLVSSS